MIIPIELKEIDGITEIFTYKRAEHIALALEKNYKNILFSEESIGFIDKELRPLVKEWGYIPDKRVEGYILNYTSAQINKGLILSSTTMLYNDDDYVNLTGIDLEATENNDPYFVSIIDGKIVSACGVNAYIDELKEVEVNITTAPKYRGNGYGASNVMAMTEHFTKRGYKVTYNCSVKNEKSIRVAEKCGFKRIGRSYYYICYRED